MNFPQYCKTLEEAENCADAIAEEYELDNKTIKKYSTVGAILYYESDTLRMIVELFHDNWYESQHCFSFQLLALERNDNILTEQLPDMPEMPGNPDRKGSRKRPDYFAEDVRRAVYTLGVDPRSGRVKGTIYEWNGDFGFVRATNFPRIFLSSNDISPIEIEKIRLGTELRFKITVGANGPKAADISVINPKPVLSEVLASHHAKFEKARARAREMKPGNLLELMTLAQRFMEEEQSSNPSLPDNNKAK